MMPSQTGSTPGIVSSAGATIGTTTKMISKASITKPSRNIASITASTAPFTPPGKLASARCTMSSPPSARNTRLNSVAPINMRKIMAVMLAMFLLGFVMDAFEIIFVVVPIVAPALLTMPGVDPVWLGIMMAMNLQTSYLHPPLGPTLFYLRGVAPPEITTRHIYVGIIPFVLIQLFALVVLWSVPGLATMLPHALYGR